MLNFGLLKGVIIMAKRKNDTSAKTQVAVAKKKAPEKSTANNGNACAGSFKGSK